MIALLAACSDSRPAPAKPGGDEAVCTPGAPAIELSGSVTQADAKTYRMLPFEVAPGTGRIELSYGWSDAAGPPPTPLTATTFDLGLWDQHGYRSAEGFRGWSGSRQGRIDLDQAPAFVEAASAERGYVPGAIEPGTWFVDLGIAAVSPQGADWRVVIECKAAGGVTPTADPVDRAHVARREAGWYLGDFHMHAYHSNASAPDWNEFIAQARAAQIDFLMVTEYVTGAHWDTLGSVQRINPDLLIWPGREVITYFGHVNTHGETPSVLEYRHGFEDVNIREIQRLARQDGALFQVNHPTIFPGPVFENFCRGCEFRLGNEIDWSEVELLEVVNGPVLATGADIGLPLPGQAENPFLQTALDLWDDLMAQGYKITAVSGSDSKGVEPDEAERIRRGYGSSATAVYAPELSRTAVSDALKAGHAYIRARGIYASPELEFLAIAGDGREAMFGDTLDVAQGEPVTLRTTVSGGMGQRLRYVRNGAVILEMPVLTDPFVHEFPLALRDPLSEGPLGTYYRIETLDTQTRTAIGNPVFLAPPPAS